MSHCPGPTLEDFLTDWFGFVYDDGSHGSSIRHFYADQLILTPEQALVLVAMYEPYRKEIEYVIERYDDEEESWRDYRSYNFDFIPDELNTKASEYLKNLNCQRTRGL